MGHTTKSVKWITCCNCGRQYAGEQCPFCQYRPINLAEIFRRTPMPIIPRLPLAPEIEALPINVPIRRIASYFEVDIDPDECCAQVCERCGAKETSLDPMLRWCANCVTKSKEMREVIKGYGNAKN